MCLSENTELSTSKELVGFELLNTKKAFLNTIGFSNKSDVTVDSSALPGNTGCEQQEPGTQKAQSKKCKSKQGQY